MQTVSERDVLERVAGKFKAHLEARKNPIMAAVKFDRRRQQPGESFDSFVTHLKLVARGLDITETEKLIRDAIACKALDDRVRQRCLEKSKNLTLNTAIDIGRMFEATKDGMQVIKIDPTAKPVVHGPRRQPAALLPKIKDKLKEMENDGHLAKVIQPTDWVNSMVVSCR